MNRQSPDRIAVIGAGLGGLSAACTLAARGYTVTLFEKNPWNGGKASVLEASGFRFDMGPTILTVPTVLKRVFAEAGRQAEDYLELKRLDPQWRSFFDDGSVLDLVENVAQMKKHLAEFSPHTMSADGYEDFLSVSERLHEISEKFFFWKSVESIRDTLDLKQNMDPKTLADVMNLRMGTTVAGTVRKRAPDARVAQMLDHFTQYVGSSPYNAPAVLCAIAHMQTDLGVWYPMGGTRAVPAALESLASDLGVEIRNDVRVHRIVRQGRRVIGVKLENGDYEPFGAVVSNMDSIRTYKELVGGEIGQKYDRPNRYQPSCSGVVLYLGLDKAYEHLLHHNFVFSRDPEEEFDAIYKRGEPAPDPTCYVAAPARTDPTVAPEGGEALYVLVHTPSLRPRHDWSQMLPEYRRVILNKLKRSGGMVDIEERLVFEAALTPKDIHERYNVLDGAIYGLASHGRFFGAFKPGNRSRDVDGLYLCGGAAHPGPGMPMTMMSGWIAADSLDTDFLAAKAV